MRVLAMCAVFVASQAAADPATTTTTKPAADLAALLARTEAVAKEVAKVRGLPLKHAIPNDVVDKDELRARLVKQAADAKTVAQTTAEELSLKRWGLIPLATDYPKLLLDLLTEQIAGYYDPETKKLTISKSAGDDAQWAEMVLAHELDHGLQDQSFDLHRFEDLPDTEGDAEVARHALVEGDGIALMIEVMLGRTHTPVPWSDPKVADMLGKAMSTPGNGDGLDRAPLAIREAMVFPYRAGLAFVAALRRHQAWSAVDAAFAHPPRSTEQIMHPERYVADDPPVPVKLGVPAALPGYAIAQSTVWGELGFDLFLRSHRVDDSVAAVAAAGWGGDRAIVLTKNGDLTPEHAVGIIRMVWDSEADAIEATEAAGRAMDDAIVGGTAERSQTHTRWVGVDGKISWIERRGPALVIVIGAPAYAATALAAELH